MSYKIAFVDEFLHNRHIQKFLDNCSDATATKVLRQLQYLQEFGINQANPHLRKLANTNLWEVRILGKHNVRVLCSQYRNNQIIVLHIFIKKSMKTPTKEIKTASQLLQKALEQ